MLRTVKAFWINLLRSGRVEGASTITQQLAKNLFFTFQRTYQRKLRELLVALQIEARYSKNEILDAYVNQIAGVGRTAEQPQFFRQTRASSTWPSRPCWRACRSRRRATTRSHFERAKGARKWSFPDGGGWSHFGRGGRTSL
jgi:penicillin-binding protein 1A